VIQTNNKKNGLVISGRPIVYNKPTLIESTEGKYSEIIKSGALDGADISDCRLFYNHDLNRVPLARTPKTMQLMIDERGLEMTAFLPDTEEARSIHTAIKRGDLTGMSFAFKVPTGGDIWEGNRREIHKIEKVYELSVVPFPAYQEASVEARNKLKSIQDSMKKAVIIKCNQIILRGWD
jgi:HK97 family phage prohead protease